MENQNRNVVKEVSELLGIGSPVWSIGATYAEKLVEKLRKSIPDVTVRRFGTIHSVIYRRQDSDKVQEELRRRVDFHKAEAAEYEKLLRSVEEDSYEYEMFFNSGPEEPVQIHGWYPIATDRIRIPEKIDEYIAKGILRRRGTAGNHTELARGLAQEAMVEISKKFGKEMK